MYSPVNQLLLKNFKKFFKAVIRVAWHLSYDIALFILWPLNCILIFSQKHRAMPRKVLHISYMVHTAYHTTRILRQNGIEADYLSKGSNPNWNLSDFKSPETKFPFLLAFKEFFLFWKIVARYEIVHLHFAHTMTQNGWELPILKKLKRKVVIHYRGCEIRDVRVNKRLHPKMNICENS